MEAMIGKGKRPRDPNQLAAWTVAVSTGQIPAEEPAPAIPVSSSGIPGEHLRVHGCYRSQGRSDWRKAPSQDHDQGSNALRIAAKAAKARWKQAKAKRPR